MRTLRVLRGTHMHEGGRKFVSHKRNSQETHLNSSTLQDSQITLQTTP